jgi:hydrogenase/urease accessory protein HupE
MTKTVMQRTVSVAISIAGMLPGLAAAHVGQGDVGGGLWAGILHPISSRDCLPSLVLSIAA